MYNNEISAQNIKRFYMINYTQNFRAWSDHKTEYFEKYLDFVWIVRVLW